MWSRKWGPGRVGCMQTLPLSLWDRDAVSDRPYKPYFADKIKLSTSLSVFQIP